MPRHTLFLIALSLGLPGTLTAQPPGESGEWHVSRYGGEMRAWFPEADFAPEPQESPYMLMYEVSRYPFTPKPTAEQQQAADELVARSRAAAEAHGWFDFEKAVADGFELLHGDSVHYAHREFITDGKTLDPERPEFLMFYDTAEGKRLVGYMYLTSSPEARGPQIGGPLTVWHYHIWAVERCLLEGLMVIGDLDETGRCAEGVATHRSPEMMHVWFIDHPQGKFATKMRLPEWLLNDLGHHGHH